MEKSNFKTPCGGSGKAVTEASAIGIWKAPRQNSPAVAYLSQTGNLDRMIRLRKSKLEIMRDALSLQSVKMSDMPKAPSPSLQSLEDKLCDILTLEGEIRDLERDQVRLKADMMGMIGKIESADSQAVLIQCFLNLRSTAQMCEDLHFSKGWLLKLKARAITEMEQVLEQEGELGKWQE